MSQAIPIFSDEEKAAAKDAVGAVVPIFSPEEVESAKEELSNKPGMGEALARGAGQGATAGFGDELSALLELGLGKVFSPDAYENDTYSKLRDIYRGENKASQEAHPWAYMGGQVVGSLPTAIATGGATPGLARTVATQAAQGAAMAAGESEANPLEEPGALLKDTTKGAGFGAGGALVGAGAGKVLTTMFPRLAAKAAGQATARAVEQEAAESAASKAGKEAGEELATKAAGEGAEEAAGTVGKETAEAAIERPVVTPKDQLLARLGEKDANVVAYGRARGGEKALERAPSLDATATDGLRTHFDAAVERVNDKLKGWERQAGKLIEKSGLEVSNADMANLIKGQLDELRSSGFAETKPGQAAIKELEDKLTAFVGETETGTPYIKAGKRSAKWLREYLQGLREENRSFYSKVGTGNSYSSQQEAINNLTQSIDNILKTRIDGYAEVMAPYSKDLRAYLAVKKSMGRQQVADFFTNKVKKPAQDLLFGVRSPDEKWAGVLEDFGHAAGQDFLGQAKDRLAFAHLFPEKVATAEMPSIPTELAGMAHGFLKMGAEPVSGAMHVAKEVAGPASRYVKKKMFEKAFEEAAHPAAASVGEKTAAALLSGSDKFGNVINAASRFLPPAAGVAASTMTPTTEAPPESGPPLGWTGPSETARATPSSIAPSRSSASLSEPGASGPQTKEELPGLPAPEDKTRPSRESAMVPVGSRHITYANPERLPKYKNVFAQAEKRGGNSVAATHYMLMQTDPEYRKTYEESQRSE